MFLIQELILFEKTPLIAKESILAFFSYVKQSNSKSLSTVVIISAFITFESIPFFPDKVVLFHRLNQ